MGRGARVGPRGWYGATAASHAEAAERIEDAARRLGRFRVGSALAAVALTALVEPLYGVAAAGAVGAAVVSGVAFVAVVARQGRLRRAARGERIRESLAVEGLARLDRDWDALALVPESQAVRSAIPPDHPYAADLGLFGHASLERLCGPVTTARGRERLAGWLLEPATAGVAVSRREAVAALATAADQRLELAALGRSADPETPGDVERFLTWAEAPGWLGRARFARIASWILPPVTVGLMTLQAYALLGVVTVPWAAAPLWMAPLVLQGVALHGVVGRIAADLRGAAAVGPSLSRYGAQLAAVGGLPKGAAALDEVVARAGDGLGASEALRRLGRRVDWVETRANAYYPVANYLLLADVHLHRSLERWKARHGAGVRGWIEALADAEALAALATLAHDHPGWAFPDVGEGGVTVEPVRARALGHPLLPPAACARNDVAVPPPGAFLLVTGSNMSGKSTLLRAIGANVVLALAGGPVCAASLALTPVRLFTSMSVDDSLEAGVSRFMAELLRMKAVVEAARATGPADPPVLYLLDEVLQGTNSGERRAGARTVLRHLLDLGAVGALTTHDLTLHQAPDLEGRAHAFHFRESVAGGDGGPRLAFDYRLRPGLSTTKNALSLLRAVGLGPGEGHPDPEEEAEVTAARRRPVEGTP